MPGWKNLTAAIRAPFAKRFGVGDREGLDFAQDSDYIPRWRDSQNSTEFEFAPSVQTFSWTRLATAEIVDQTIFVANNKMRIISVRESHSVAGSDAGAVTLQLRKEVDTQAPGAGVALLSSALSLKTTADTPQLATLTNNSSALNLKPGDRLSVDITGTTTDLAGVTVTVEYVTETRTRDIVFNAFEATKCVDTVFHVFNRPTTVKAVRFVHSVVASDSGAVTAHVEKNDGTDAPGSGTTIQSGTFNCKATVNTVQAGTLTSTAADLAMVAGDRLAVDFTGTVTDLAGVCIVVSVEEREPNYQEVTYYFVANAGLGDQNFFIADAEYEVLDGWATWSTAFAASVNFQLVKDSGVVAPGAGTNLLTQDSAAGFQGDGTANTPENATFTAARSSKLLGPGDRLSIDYSATTTGVGPCMTIALRRLGKKVGT